MKNLSLKVSAMLLITMSLAACGDDKTTTDSNATVNGNPSDAYFRFSKLLSRNRLHTVLIKIQTTDSSYLTMVSIKLGLSKASSYTLVLVCIWDTATVG